MAATAAGADDDDPAAGSDSSFVTRSTVRSGHKREFDFALRAHAQLPSSLGRTRRASRPATPDDAVTKRPRGDRDNPIAAAPPLQLNPAKPESPAPPPAPKSKLMQSKLKSPTPTLATVKLETPMEQVKLKALTPSPSKHKSPEPTRQSNLKTQELKQPNHQPPAPPLESTPVKLKTPSPSPAGALEPGPVKLETPMEQVKLKAPTPSPSKHKSLEPTRQSNLKTQELKQPNHKPPAPPLESTPLKLKTPSPYPAGALEPGPVKLKAPAPNGEVEPEQVKMKSSAALLGPVKLEMALEREQEQVKAEVAGTVQEMGKCSLWELSPRKTKFPTAPQGLFATGLLDGVPLKYITSPEKEVKQLNRKPPAPPLELTPVKLKAPSLSPSPAGALEPGLKQSNHKPPAPPLELTPVKLRTPSLFPAGALEPGLVKLNAPILNAELEPEQVKLKSPAAHLCSVKLETALEREQVKPEVAGSVQEVGKYSPWAFSLGRTKTPMDVEGLFATGLLEGVTLKYITSREKKDGLKGVVKGNSILCHCASCKGLRVISANQFEQHAGSSSDNPAAFICFENGKTIRCVLQACKLAPLGMLEVWIKSAISLDTTITCQKCNKTLDVSGTGKFASLCDSCLAFSDSVARLSLVSDCSGSTSKKISSEKITFGKLTRKDLGLHKMVFIGDTLPEGTEVSYYDCGKRILEGYIKDSGIFCLCCRSVVSPSLFEAHAGHAQRRKPYHHIYISNGVSLHELSVSLSKGRKLPASETDDLCSICADGGELLLCDLCPRAFHTDCVGLFSIPEGDWHCRYCENMLQREKYECNANAIAAGRVAGVDPLEQILKRRIQIVESPSTIDEGCVFCRCHDFSTEFGPRSVLLCDQCEREYHIGCLKDHNLGNLKELPEEEWFCSTDCTTINATLQNLIFHGVHQLHDRDSEILKRLGGKGVNITWRLLSGKILGPDGPHKKIIDRDTSSLFKGVVSILHESFDAIVETETGQDLIPCMVYGRKTKTGDFGGLYCAVLIVNSSVVSTGILRVLGRKVAELPLVATSAAHQRQGYFQSLFKCIERLLASLNVEHLVLPATEEAEPMWTSKFGFKRIPEAKMREYTGGGHAMVLEGTKMLHKLVPRDSISSKECQGR